MKQEAAEEPIWKSHTCIECPRWKRGICGKMAWGSASGNAKVKRLIVNSENKRGKTGRDTTGTGIHGLPRARMGWPLLEAEEKWTSKGEK